MLIYLTGSSGFLGSHFAEYFRDSVNIVHIDHNNLYSPGYPRGTYSVFLHLGWSGVLGRYKDSSTIQQRNLQMAPCICDFLNTYQVDMFIGLGSQAEYLRTQEVITEETPLQPQTEYGRTKIAFSSYLSKHCIAHGIRFKWIRLFDVYGPGDHPNWLLPYVINSFLINQVPSLSHCNQLWDYLYVEDACKALYQLCKNPNIEDGAYNLCSGVHIPIRRVVQIAQHLTGSTIEPAYGNPDIFMPSIRGSNQKLLNLSIWQPETDIMSGISSTIKHFKQIL